MAATTVVALCAIGATLLCMLAAVSASPPVPGARYDQPPPPPMTNSKFTCADTEKKRPGCTGTCPDSCPQKCIVKCPNCTTFCPEEVHPPQHVPPAAIFVFGDGTMDLANSDTLPLVPIKTPRNDVEDALAEPQQGQFSDGFNLAYYISLYMGAEGGGPAGNRYTGPVNIRWGFEGVNYACAGAGLLNATNEGLTVPMLKQLDAFKTTIGQLEGQMSASAVKDLLSKSLFLISVGTMDLTAHNTPAVPALLAAYGRAITSMYKMGARRLGIVNLGPLGQGGYERGYDVAGVNALAAEFNNGLKPLLAGVAPKLRGLRYSIADLGAYANAVFANPSAYGIENVADACNPGASVPQQYKKYFDTPCSNPADYWYWDDAGYITEHAANLAAAAFVYGPTKYTSPVTFQGLLDKK